jgi:hypothetical protein
LLDSPGRLSYYSDSVPSRQRILARGEGDHKLLTSMALELV